MFALKIFVLSVLVLGVTCRSTFVSEAEYETPEYEYIPSEEPLESVHPVYMRVRRQTQGSVNTNPDGSVNINAKIPLAGNDVNKLSAIASAGGLKNGGGFGSVGGGLALENVNGHALTATGRHIPGFGDQLTGAAKIALLNTDNHKLNANAFITKNMPNIPHVPDFNTKGGSLDYMFRNKVGGSLGMAQTDFLQRKDYSAMGNLNLFRNPTTSLDLNAGYTKSVSPFMPNSNWQPSGGLTFTRFW